MEASGTHVRAALMQRENQDQSRSQRDGGRMALETQDGHHLPMSRQPSLVQQVTNDPIRPQSAASTGLSFEPTPTSIRDRALPACRLSKQGGRGARLSGSREPGTAICFLRLSTTNKKMEKPPLLFRKLVSFWSAKRATSPIGGHTRSNREKRVPTPWKVETYLTTGL